MTYHGKIFLLPKHHFFPPGEAQWRAGALFGEQGAQKKMVAHYVALNPIVCLLVASINRPLSGCLNQNDSNTGSVMMPSQHSILNRETDRGRKRGEEKTTGKRRGKTTKGKEERRQQDERGEAKKWRKKGANC